MYNFSHILFWQKDIQIQIQMQSNQPFYLSYEGICIENAKYKFSYKVKVKSHFVRPNAMGTGQNAKNYSLPNQHNEYINQ